MIEIKFTEICKTNNDSINGVARFYEDGTEEIKYYDDNFIGEFDRPMAISNELAKAIHKFDLTNLLGLYDEDDIHIIHNFNTLMVIVNPNEDFMDTLCHESTPVLPVQEDAPCTKRTSIGDAIESIIDNEARCTRLNHNTVLCEIAGSGVSWKVCLGDVELTDAFVSSIRTFMRV